MLPLAACASDETIWVAPPSLDGVASIVVLADDGTRRVAYAAPFDAITSLTLPDGWSGQAPFDLSLLGYEEDLAALGVSAGTITPGSSRCALLEPKSAHRTRVAMGEVPSWTSLDDVSDRDAAYLTVGGRDGCLAAACQRFTMRTVPMDATSLVDGLTTIDEDTAVAMTGAGRLFRVFQDRTEPLDVGLSFTVRALWSAGDGTLWLGGQRGQVAYGRLGETFEVIRTSTVVEPIRAVVAGGDPVEVFAFSLVTIESGVAYRTRFYRWQAGSWETLSDTIVPDADGSRTHVRRLGARDAIAIYGGLTLFSYRDGTVREIDFAQITGQSLLNDNTGALELVDSFGVVLASTSGPIYAAQDPLGLWNLVSDDSRRAGSNTIEPYARGFLAFPDIGESRQFHPGGVSCDPIVVNSVETEHSARVGPSIVLGGDVGDGLPRQVAVLDPQ